MIPTTPLIVRYSGNSMWPVFQDGDLLEVEPLPLEQVRRGDCVVFHNAAGYQVVHRVLVSGTRLRTRGDALPAADLDEVSRDSLFGRVTRRYRQGRGSSVGGGWSGRLAGRYYPLAGRIDPLRQARGGAIARKLRGLSMFLLEGIGKRGQITTVARSGQAPVVVWYWGRWTVGRQDSCGGEWLIYWPWRVFLECPPDRGALR